MDFSMESSTHDVVVAIELAVPPGMASGSVIRLPEQEKITVETCNLIPEITGGISPVSMSTSQTPRPVPNNGIRRRASLGRATFLKSKSRLVELPSPSEVSEDTQEVASKSPLKSTPHRASPRTSALTPRTPRITMTSAREQDEEDHSDVYKSNELLASHKYGKKLTVFVLVEWILFVSLMSLLITSLTIHRLQYTFLWSLALWKWCVLGIVVFCGRLVTARFTSLVFCIMEQNYFLQRKFVYFVHGLKGTIWVFLWFGLILLSWVLLFSRGVHRSKKTTKMLDHVTVALAGFLVGAGMWLLKSLLIKTIALSFHVERFFDRIQESLFHQYMLQILSGPSLMELDETDASSKDGGQLSFKDMLNGKEIKEEVINVKKLHKIDRRLVFPWTMKGLINVIKRTKLSTISSGLDDGEEDQDEFSNLEITNELEAKAAAEKIFKKLAITDEKYIEDTDLLRFLKIDEADRVFPSFEGAVETGKITKSAFVKWVVNAYLERKWLTYSLTDTGTSINDLDKIVSTLVLVALVIVWNLMMGFLTVKILVFLTSQLLLLAFMFGNTVKTMFEAIIFVFVMHPFDVGDRCVIDGVQMVVEEMKIFSTILLGANNEKISYPNSVLATKPISNFYRSPEMSDSVKFAIDFSTTAETIAALRERIKRYIESKPQHWRPSHSVQVNDILDMNKITMGLGVIHTINYQESGLKSERRSDLVLELKNIFDELGIRYSLPPQDVHVAYVGSPSLPHITRS